MRSARLFAAVSFTPAEKQALAASAQALRGLCAAGRFPDPALLHITLHFFGQTPLEKLNDIETAMGLAAAGASPFTLATGRAGAFGRDGSAVLWLGIGEGATELKALQAALERELHGRGFPAEAREFKAHITVGRDVRFVGSPAEVALAPTRIAVNAITLMESTQAGGKLEYVPLLHVPFIPAK